VKALKQQQKAANRPPFFFSVRAIVVEGADSIISGCYLQPGMIV
jgi:hypothetical protein